MIRWSHFTQEPRCFLSLSKGSDSQRDVQKENQDVCELLKDTQVYSSCSERLTTLLVEPCTKLHIQNLTFAFIMLCDLGPVEATSVIEVISLAAAIILLPLTGCFKRKVSKALSFLSSICIAASGVTGATLSLKEIPFLEERRAKQSGIITVTILFAQELSININLITPLLGRKAGNAAALFEILMTIVMSIAVYFVIGKFQVVSTQKNIPCGNINNVTNSAAAAMVISLVIGVSFAVGFFILGT